MAEYMDLSEPHSPKFLLYSLLVSLIIVIALMVGSGIRDLKDSRAAEKAKVEQKAVEQSR